MVAEERYRFEKKYVLTEAQARYGENLLRHWMRTDDSAGPDGSYRVRSLYFDDQAKSAFYDKEDGVNVKKKYRARFYLRDAGDPPSSIRLECKRKSGDMSVKQVSVLSDEEFGHIAGGGGFRHDAEGVLADFCRDSAWNRLLPGIIVDYRRTALEDPFSSFRVTFDRGIRAGWDFDRFFDENLISVPVYPGDVDRGVVFELKYTHAVPEHLTSLLRSMIAIPQNVSKYHLCMSYPNRPMM
jgi:hypothetical protein